MRAGLARDLTRIDSIERRFPRAKGTFVRGSTRLFLVSGFLASSTCSFDRFIVEFMRRNRSRRCSPRFRSIRRLGKRRRSEVRTSVRSYTGPRGTNANHIHKLQAPWQIVTPDPPPFFLSEPRCPIFLATRQNSSLFTLSSLREPEAHTTSFCLCPPFASCWPGRPCRIAFSHIHTRDPRKHHVSLSINDFYGRPPVSFSFTRKKGPGRKLLPLACAQKQENRLGQTRVHL